MQKAHDVGDMRIQSDVGTKQVRALAKTGQCRGDHRMTAGLKRRRDIAPAPAAKPRAGHQKKCSHSKEMMHFWFRRKAADNAYSGVMPSATMRGMTVALRTS